MSESEKRLLESVSALVDGEASEIELHRILKQLEADHTNKDQTVRSKWSRYHSVSQAMADMPLGGVDISGSVSSAIAKEPTYASTLSLTAKSKLYSMGRFAVAASIAFITIIGVQQLNQLEPTQQGANSDLFASQLDGHVKGPASQYPSGFQPNIQARTVNAVGNIQMSPQPLKIIKLTPADIEALNDQRMRNYLNEIVRNQSRTVIAPVRLSTEVGDNISSQ